MKNAIMQLRETLNFFDLYRHMSHLDQFQNSGKMDEQLKLGYSAISSLMLSDYEQRILELEGLVKGLQSMDIINKSKNDS